MSHLRRRLRGALKNVAVWGVGWTVLGFATNLLMRVTGIIDAPVSVLDAAVVGAKIGLGGGIAGAAFSAFIAVAYRNRRIKDISWLKFAIGGTVVTAASITGFVQGASLLGGGRLVEWEYMNPTLAIFSAFGFVAAAASVKLAQSAAARDPESEEVLLGDAPSAQLATGAAEGFLQRHTQAEVHAPRGR